MAPSDAREKFGRESTGERIGRPPWNRPPTGTPVSVKKLPLTATRQLVRTHIELVRSVRGRGPATSSFDRTVRSRLGDPCAMRATFTNSLGLLFLSRRWVTPGNQ